MLYERRLQLLDILDGFARNTFYDIDYTMKGVNLYVLLIYFTSYGYRQGINIR